MKTTDLPSTSCLSNLNSSSFSSLIAWALSTMPMFNKSDLATEVYEADSNNYTHGRNGYSICKITPHHMAGVLSAEECGRIFQNPSRQASSNYGIGNDGEIACYVRRGK